MGVGGRGTLLHCWWEYKLRNHDVKHYGGSSKNSIQNCHEKNKITSFVATWMDLEIILYEARMIKTNDTVWYHL